MELILVILFVLAVLYFIKGMRTPHEFVTALEPSEPSTATSFSPQLKDDLLILAEQLFTASHTEEFSQQLALFESDHDAFVEQYQAQYDFLSVDEFANLPAELIFIHFAERLHNYLCNIDWSGEREANQLKDFLQSKLDQVGFKHFDWTFLERFEASLDHQNLERDDYIIYKMLAINAELLKIGYMLITIDVGWEAYLAFIIHEQDYATIAHIQHDNLKIIAVADWITIGE